MIMKITPEYVEMLNMSFLLKTKGYSIVTRNRYLLVINGDLSEEEHFLYCLFWDVLSDWSIGHLKYGLFSVDYKDLELQLKIDESKIRRIVKSLLNKKFIRNVSKNQYQLVGFDLRICLTKKSAEFNFYQELMEQVSGNNQNSAENEKNVGKNENK